ncbi:MAG: hypothetical protein ACLPH3_12290 [Terracidiphilus sp.]
MQIPPPADQWYLLSALIDRAHAGTLKLKTPEEAIGKSDEGDERQNRLPLIFIT